MLNVWREERREGKGGKWRRERMKKKEGGKKWDKRRRRRRKRETGITLSHYCDHCSLFTVSPPHTAHTHATLLLFTFFLKLKTNITLLKVR